MAILYGILARTCSTLLVESNATLDISSKAEMELDSVFLMVNGAAHSQGKSIRYFVIPGGGGGEGGTEEKMK